MDVVQPFPSLPFAFEPLLSEDGLLKRARATTVQRSQFTASHSDQGKQLRAGHCMKMERSSHSPAPDIEDWGCW